MIALDQADWRRVDLCNLLRDHPGRFINYDISRRLDNFEFGNAPIFIDADFYQSRNLGTGGDVRCWLDPCATTGIFTGNDSDRRRCVFRNWRISSLA
jgi:hypothetical protein